MTTARNAMQPMPRAATGGAGLARDLTLSHAELLKRGREVTVAALLVEVGCCPSCGENVIRGDRVAVCTGCGSEIDL